MDNYEINAETYAILPISEYKSKVIEKEKTFVVNQRPMKIIEESCRFFGSSYLGRFTGTKNLIGVSHKAPIIIEETKEIIFFPTNSPRLYDCGWISLKNILNYKRKKDTTTLIFNNGHLLELDISFGIFDNQVLRATRLESVLRLRKKNF